MTLLLAHKVAQPTKCFLPKKLNKLNIFFGWNCVHLIKNQQKLTFKVNFYVKNHFRERSLMTSHIRVGRGSKIAPKKGPL